MSKVIIIAEAGVNHNGNLELAYKLVDAAKEAGVDYIKFQTFVTELIVDKSATKADYQKAKTGKDESQFDMIKRLELSFEDFLSIKKYCDKKKIGFLTTVADFVSLEKLDKLNPDYIKVGSGELTNLLFLRKVATKNKPVILSVGMASLGEIEIAFNDLIQQGVPAKNIIILHCNTEYPTPMEDVNLKAMNTIAEAFKVQVGYSDHTLGIEVPIAAVSLGASVIEKHFTLDKTLPGPDHAASLEPNELINMVRSIRNIEKALSGSGKKEPSSSEKKNIIIVRKSIFSKTAICKGEKFTEDNIILKRPGDGIPAIDIDKVISKKAGRNINAGIKLSYNDISW